jgi:hypothetical protein
VGLPALEHEEQKLRRVRRLHQRPDKQLTATARKVLKYSLSRHPALGSDTGGISAALFRDLTAGQKPRTQNMYAPYYLKWKRYCQTSGSSDMPAEPLQLATFLSESSTDDKTMEPTKKRVGAVNYFHSLAGHPPPCGDPFVQRVVQGIKRRLGSLGIPQRPISLNDIWQARAQAAASGESGLKHVADICAIMQEAELRWDDIADLRVGDIVWGTMAVRLLIVDSKTDRKRQGQFGTLAVSQSPQSGYQQLRQLILSGIRCFAQSKPRTQRRLLEDLKKRLPGLPYSSPSLSALNTAPADIRSSAASCQLPLENLPLLSRWQWQEKPSSLLEPLSYKCFMFHLKRLFSGQPKVGTHSMRRGGVTEKMAQGVEARLVQWLGRWSTTEAFEGYVGSRANIAAAAAAVERARKADSAAPEGGNGPSTVPTTRRGSSRPGKSAARQK